MEKGYLMKNNNDKRILELKETIKKKKNKIIKLKKFSPITNCSLNLSEKRYNIHTLTLDKLTLLLIELNLYKISANDLGIKYLVISGYKIDEWISDIKQKIDIFNIEQEKKDLDILEKKLTSLLSDNTKTELEINEISNLLNNK
jgi:hypothetical protein